ncbi:TonB-dependent receptor [Asticcacaulis sp. EMRT-3]|uniref:TonB-dependent receptor n=1 Tax=Asticcacaulis sp. EMRT-3 TaxID=3040349 RepID=UPI0024AF7CD4|nr:TonB-dependent receptor [Asticcacaulis sp. EMRT-3]MDI7776497.1 TonB-dependent receptor [Asticcacaulis sp. EMRT-3]
MFGLALLACPCIATARTSATTYHLPAEALDRALIALGAQAHVTIVFVPSTVSGKRAPALEGTYSPDDALHILLAGTGLGYSRSNGGAYMVTAVKPAARPADPRSVDDVTRADASQPQYTPTIIVRGYKASLRQSLNIRRAYSGELESVVAEDIAKLPDNNVAEALQRIAGISISRDQGEGRTLSVRGLGPEFTRVEINGLGIQAATDGPTQGVNTGRGVDFNVFPSELFSRIDVRKTSGADQAEGSLGANIDLMTPHPFDLHGPALTISSQTTYNDLSARTGRRAAFLASRTFDQGRFGALFSAAYNFTPLDIQGVNSGGWNQGTANGGFCQPTAATGGLCDVPAADLAASLGAYALSDQPTTYHPQFYRYTDLTGSAEHLGVNASLQWHPSGQTTLTLDALYARFRTQRSDHFIEAIGFSRGAAQGGKPEIVPRRVALDAHDTMTYGLFDNVDVRSELGIDNFSTDFHQISLQLKHTFSDKVFIEILGGSSGSVFDNAEDLTVQMDRLNVDGYSFDTRATGRERPAIDYNFDVTNPVNWYFGPRVAVAGGTGRTGPEIRLRPNFVYNDNQTLQAKLTYDPNSHLRLSFGLQAKRYDYKVVSYRFDQGEADFPAPSVPMAALTQTFCGLKGVNPPPGTPRCWLEPDVQAFITAYDLFADTGKTVLSTTNAAARGNNRAVHESDESAYAKLWFSRSLFGKPLRGDIGVRLIGSRQESIFYSNVPLSADPAGFVVSQVERHYSDILPSTNIVFDSSAHTLWRFSAARVMARPPLSYIAAATSVIVNGGNRLVLTGNPYLKPYRASTYDLSYEWYPARGGIVSLGLFYKDITNYVQALTHIAPFSTTGLPSSLLANTGASAGDDFAISTVVNTHGGPLQGFEFNYQQPLKFLPGIWSKFGTTFNYTYVISRIDYSTTSPTGPQTIRADLLNLSRNSANATLYFSDGPLQARLSANYRDKYLTAVPGPFNMDASGVNGGTYLDFSLDYKLTPDLALTFEGLNLTDQGTETWNGLETRLVTDTRLSGRQFALGLRYTYRPRK